MRDIAFDLRRAYFSLLSQLDLPIYDEHVLYEDAPIRYIILGDQTERDESTKTCDTHRATIIVDIVTKFTRSQIGGRMVSEGISNDVHQLVYDTGLTLPSYLNQVIHPRKELSRSLVEHTPTHNIYRKIISFTHLIREV